jgi:hypothetical protein
MVLLKISAVRPKRKTRRTVRSRFVARTAGSRGPESGPPIADTRAGTKALRAGG